MKMEVELSKKSQEYIDFLTENYTQIFECPKQITGSTLIHIYPMKDTLNDESEDSSGFEDALNCEIHIYDKDNRTVFVTKTHDQIEVEVPCNIRIFKDLSTMLIIDTPVRFGMFQSLEVRKVL